MVKNAMGKKILIADNYQGVRSLLDTVISEMGYETLVYDDGRGAWDGYANHNPDMAILGGKLAGKKTMKIIEDVRRKDPEFPIVVISGGYSDTGLHYEDIDYLKSGRDRKTKYISKPFHNDEIREAIRDFLGETHSRETNK